MMHHEDHDAHEAHGVKISSLKARLLTSYGALDEDLLDNLSRLNCPTFLSLNRRFFRSN